MRKKEDTYQMWERTGVLKSKLDYIKAASATFYTQKDMCHDLGISEQTFIALKDKHPEIQQAISDGEALLLQDLFSALKTKAMGHKEKITSKTMRKNPIGGTETKVTEDEKYYPPDFEVIKYILIMKFGKDFDPKKFMIEMMEKKNEPEEWVNAARLVGADEESNNDEEEENP